MDVVIQSNIPEERMSEHRSLSSNHRYCSQSRKISIGVLVDSISKAERKDLKETVMQIAENDANRKGNCITDCEGHTPLVEKHITAEQKDTSPWVSTRSLNPKGSSSVAVQGTEHTPSFPAISRRRPRSKLLEKTSTAHSLKYFAAKSGLESDECRQNNTGKDICSTEAAKVNNAEHVDNLICSTEPGVRLEKEQVEDKDRTTETGGRETLRMKLWEILGNVSSPNKHCPSPKCAELHPDQERDRKQSPIEKVIPGSDTIESDSQKHSFRRPMTRSITQRKTFTKKQSNKIEATKSIDRKECRKKRIFSFREDRSGRLYDNFNDGSLPSKRNKTFRMSSGVETHQGRKYENAERLQSEKSRSIPAIEKSMVHRTKVFNASSSYERRNDVPVEPKKVIKINASFENVMTEQKDLQQPIDVKVSKKNQREDISDSLFRDKRNSVHNPSTCPSEIKLRGCLPKSKEGKFHERSPAKIFKTTGIRSFKNLLSSKSAESKPNVQVEPSDGRCEQNDSPKNSLPVKPSVVMEEDGENQMSKSSTHKTGSESSEDEAHMKGCRESGKLSPEICISENFRRSKSTSLASDRDVEVTACSPASDSLEDKLKGIEDTSELEMYLEQNHEDGLARAVAIFTVALTRVTTKLKSFSSRRSAEILRAAIEEIFLRLQNAESLIKTDVGKLINLSHLERKRQETRFQEQQDQLLGIYEKFKEEFDQHLQGYGSLLEDLEEQEIELKRSVEKQRAAHKKFLSQVEQEISVQLNDAESRIMAVQELARKKMLHLKLGLAECLKHGAFD